MVDQTLCVMLIGLLSLVQTKHLRYVRITLHICLYIQFVRVDKALQVHFQNSVVLINYWNMLIVCLL